MNVIQKLRLSLMLKFPRIQKKPKKKELWERDLTFYQRFKINSRIAWRRFDTQTRGMGLMFVIVIGLMLVVNIIPLVLGTVIKAMETAPYKEALTTACKDKEFYNWNFRECETVEVRPWYITQH